MENFMDGRAIFCTAAIKTKPNPAQYVIDISIAEKGNTQFFFVSWQSI